MSRVQPQKRPSKPAFPERSDEELLSRFITAADQAAFTVLTERYERLVLNVCWRVLRHWQDAEDACQTTFVVLWRKAGVIRDKRKLNCWLYGVAYRQALRARKSKKRRENHEGLYEEGDLAQDTDKTSYRELQTLLNAAVQGLPEKYRVPIMLCCLEGKSKAEAIAELGWQAGTVSCRLARGRELLRRRLERYGITCPAGQTSSR